MDAPGLTVIDLEGNDIADKDQLEFIGACESLRHIVLASNPVSDNPLYHSTVCTAAPATLVTLDERAVSELASSVPDPGEEVCEGLGSSSGCQSAVTKQLQLVVRGLKALPLHDSEPRPASHGTASARGDTQLATVPLSRLGSANTQCDPKPHAPCQQFSQGPRIWIRG